MTGASTTCRIRRQDDRRRRVENLHVDPRYLIRAYMAGAIPRSGGGVCGHRHGPDRAAALVGSCSSRSVLMLYLLGFDLPDRGLYACAAGRDRSTPGFTWGGVLRNWTLVFSGISRGIDGLP